MVYDLSEQPGIHQLFLSRLRDRNRQSDRAGFRKNVERLGQILAYEISRKLAYREISTETPLGTAIARIPATDPLLCCILRAGLPFYQGFQDFFPDSPSGFIGAFRGEIRVDNSFDIEMGYHALPESADKPLILIDPMLATGKSMLLAGRVVLEKLKPSRIIFASLIASPEGIALLQKEMPEAEVWTIATDQGLNDHSYIIPGLGDAGDLSFGSKIS